MARSTAARRWPSRPRAAGRAPAGGTSSRRARRAGRFGPADERELYDDYCRLAIADQERCGLDIVTDGEHRRRGWIENITAALPGLSLRPAPRRLGALGYDMLDVWELARPFDGPRVDVGLRAASSAFLRAHTTRRPRVGMPGPYGMTTELDFAAVYPSRKACAEAFVPALRAHIGELVDAGCDYIQLEEPITPAVADDDRTPAAMVDLINQIVDGFDGCTFTVHICFGSFRRLPYAKRTYRWLFPRLLDANVHGFSLEFGGREMAEIDLVGQWDRGRILSAGLIDIKTHYAETPEDIVERVRTCLKYRQPDELEISTDCGLRRVPRNLAMRKMSAAVTAARRVRAMAERFRADTVGSLLRPPELKAAMDRGAPRRRAARATGRRGPGCLALQTGLGLPVVGDGELRRRIWHGPVLDVADGFDPEGFVRTWTDAPADGQPHLAGGGRPLAARGSLVDVEARFVLDHTDRPSR